jgi:hypothetical protein
MDRLANRPRLEVVQRLLADRANPCGACGRHVPAERPNVQLRGMWFHARCAVYRPRGKLAA